MSEMQFADRRDAGRRLAAELLSLAQERPIVVALPRGGVPVAVEVAKALDAPLDILAVRERTVIVVDDGLATGLSDLAAIRALRKRGARRIVVAVPVGSRESVAMLGEEADQVLCLMIPDRLYGVGLWYEDFAPVSDEEVLALLEQAGGGSD